MIRVLLTSIFLCGYCFVALAQVSSNMLLLGSYDDNNLPTSGGVQYNDVWGYSTADDVGVVHEYALVGARSAVLFLDVTDPTNITEIAAIGGGSNTTWRDIKTFGTYAYGVSDVSTAEGLLVFDISNITGDDIGPRVSLVNQMTTDFTKCHNIFIDEHGFLYAVGFSGTSGSTAHIIIYELNTDPVNPTLVASLAVNGGYIHDIYVENHRAYASSGTDGHYIFDMSAVTDPAPGAGIGDEVELARIEGYQFEGYSHSSWVSGDYMIFADETHGSPLNIADISDVTDINILDRFRSNLLGVANPNSPTGIRGPIAHNPFIIDNLCYVSHYHDGVVIFDITDPENVVKVGHYDTEPDNTDYSGSSGVWGVYPFLPSGKILGTDMKNGLFVLQYVAGLPVSWEKLGAETQKDFIQIDWTTAMESNNAGFFVQRQTIDGQWHNLGFVEPRSEQAYQFKDYYPLAGTNIYRILQQDFDGKKDYSALVSARWEEASSDWQVYPNPLSANQTATITGLSPESSYLEIWTIQGQLLQQIPISINTLTLPRLPTGVYLLRDEQGKTQRLLVE